MRLSVLKAIVFKKRSHKFSFTFQYFIQHLLIVNMMTSLRPVLHWSTLQLLLVYRFNLLDCIECVMLGAPKIALHTLLFVFLAIVVFGYGPFSAVEVTSRPTRCPSLVIC